jgi:hypothetical protein
VQIGKRILYAVRAWHGHQPVGGTRVSASLDDAVDIGAAEGSQRHTVAQHLDRIQPTLRRPRIVASQGGNPTIQQLATMDEQSSHGTVEDEGRR